MAALDLPLDELIKAQKQKAPKPAKKSQAKAKATKGGAKAKAGAAKGGKGGKEKSATKKGTRAAVQPYMVVNNKAAKGKGASKGGPSILGRLGGKAGAKGTKLVVKNLPTDIDNQQLKELFQSIGEVLAASINFDRSGRSRGTASVFYAQQSKAKEAIRQFHNRTIDGVPMSVVVLSVSWLWGHTEQHLILISS